MGECELKREIRRLANGCCQNGSQSVASITRAVRLRYIGISRRYIWSLTKDIIEELNQKEF